MRGRRAATAVALLALTACGSDEEPGAAPTTAPPTTAAPATPSEPPTSAGPPSAVIVRLTLADAAIAEESYHADAGTYTTDVAKLAENGFDAEPGVELTVVSANRQRYCLKSAGGGHTYYYSSDAGQPSETPCS